MGKKYKTKFPMARIKKIMQTDEEIGKVAQAVPVLVSKALELFLEALIEGSCKETYQSYGQQQHQTYSGTGSDYLGEDLKSSSGGKRMLCSATHLKRCIEKTPQFDFLRELVKEVKEVPDEALSPLLSSPKTKKRGSKMKSGGDSALNSPVVSDKPRRDIILKLPAIKDTGKSSSASLSATAKTSIQMLMNPTDEDPTAPVKQTPDQPVSPSMIHPTTAAISSTVSSTTFFAPSVKLEQSPLIAHNVPAVLVSAPAAAAPLEPAQIASPSITSKPSASMMLLQEEEDYDD